MTQLPDALTPVIIGPTAPGKSALAVEVVLRLRDGGKTGGAAGGPSTGGGEVVSADALQIYRGKDIGTAKPTSEQRPGVPHHLIDVVDPHEAGRGGRGRRITPPATGSPTPGERSRTSAPAAQRRSSRRAFLSSASSAGKSRLKARS